MTTVSYRNLKFRVFAALFAALYILFHGRPPDFADAFTSSEFYFQLALSFSIALGLIYLVHYFTKRLDHYCDWRTQRIKRMYMQFILCVILPSFIDAVFFYFYFKENGQSIFENNFVWIDLPIVVGLFALLSSYYWLYYILLTEKEIYREIEHQNLKIDESSPNLDNGDLEIKWKGDVIRFNVAKDVLCFFRSGKQVYFNSMEGNLYKANDSIGNLATRYSAYGFIQINPGVLINKTIIEGYKSGEKRDTLLVEVRKKYQNIIGENRNYLLIITREYIKNANKHLEPF